MFSGISSKEVEKTKFASFDDNVLESIVPITVR
jgi:hypothetical protein